MKLYSITLVALTWLSACTTSTSQLVPVPDLSRPAPGDLARTVIFRGDQSLGSGRSIVVIHGDREIGTLGPGGFLAWEHTTQRRIIRVVFDKPDVDGPNLESLVDSAPESGETTYYEVNLDVSPERKALNRRYGAPLVTPLSDEEGRSRVSELLTSTDSTSN